MTFKGSTYFWFLFIAVLNNFALFEKYTINLVNYYDILNESHLKLQPLEILQDTCTFFKLAEM